VCSPAKVEEHGPDKEPVKAEAPVAKTPPKSTVRTVDMGVDAEAIAQSRKYVDAGLERFETDAEVLEKLDVEHADSLKNLPLFALTNRIIKAMAPRFFYDGYVAKKTAADTAESGKAIASGKIKTLKTVAKILGRALDGFKENKVNKQIGKAMEEMPRAVKALALEDLTVLTESDVKSSPALSNLKEKIKTVKKE
jgi:hypothetical protein